MSRPLARDELRALLHLRLLPGIGDRRQRSLVARFGSARAALNAPAKALGERAAAARGTPRIEARAARILETIDALEIEVLRDGDPGYPERLHHLHDPPALLFARGRLGLMERPAVAGVGARRSTAYGDRVARGLARALARRGVVVVSGMARGIDACAHEAALERGTIGVLGSGIDVVYPREHARLQERVAADGLLLSEFLPGESALPHHFPRRNRLIAALGRGVVVVEASERSGALITADHAADLGREVFAVPGPVDRPTSAGTNALVRDGARLVAGVSDVIEELDGVGTEPAAAESEEVRAPDDLEGEPLRLWNALAASPRHIDDLARRSEVPPAAALGALLELELRGRARQLPGKRFVRHEGNPRVLSG